MRLFSYLDIKYPRTTIFCESGLDRKKSNKSFTKMTKMLSASLMPTARISVHSKSKLISHKHTILKTTIDMNARVCVRPACWKFCEYGPMRDDNSFYHQLTIVPIRLNAWVKCQVKACWFEELTGTTEHMLSTSLAIAAVVAAVAGQTSVVLFAFGSLPSVHIIALVLNHRPPIRLHFYGTIRRQHGCCCCCCNRARGTIVVIMSLHQPAHHFGFWACISLMHIDI
jgi:hypothetical protein